MHEYDRVAPPVSPSPPSSTQPPPSATAWRALRAPSSPAGSEAAAPGGGEAPVKGVKGEERRSVAGVSFVVPPGWEDVTMVVLRGPETEPGSPLLLRAARDRMRPSDTLRSHADRVLMRMGSEAPGVTLQESRDVEVAGRPGVLMSFERATETGLEQHIVIVDPLDDPERRAWVFNMSGPGSESAAMREALGAVLRSAELTRRHGGSQPPPRAAFEPSPPLAHEIPIPGFRGPRP